MCQSLENAILQAYQGVPEAVEPILTTAKLRDDFITRVRAVLPVADEDEILQHLVRMRKRGEAKGGLPRKTK